MFKLIFLGDVVSKLGRQAVREVMPELLNKYSPDVVIANGENAAGGFGLTLETCDEIFAAGIDIITTGNHIWKKKEIIKYLETKSDKIIRPANYPEGNPGKGFTKFTLSNGETLGVCNLIGRVFMNDLVDCPFKKADEILANELSDCKYTLFDFHSEATSEKVAFGAYLDARASIVLGTHTHVQTADERILPKGTAYITDVGMCGPYDSVIGMEKKEIIDRFVTARSSGFGSVSKGKKVVNGIYFEDSANQDKSIPLIKRINLVLD